jgi:hypothetical protein
LFGMNACSKSVQRPGLGLLYVLQYLHRRAFGNVERFIFRNILRGSDFHTFFQKPLVRLIRDSLGTDDSNKKRSGKGRKLQARDCFGIGNVNSGTGPVERP